jgi:predicted transcriptional regulator
MKTPCELVVGKIMPAMRASVVKELSNKYNMKQADIARKLGITQASVSQYLSSARGAGTKMTENFPEIKTYASEISKKIAAGEDRFEWSSVLCRACKDIREKDAFCKMHKVEAHLAGCDICKKT